MQDVISALYTTVPFIVLIGYLPQIISLIRAKSDCKEISILSWLLWNYMTVVSLLYAVFVLHDLKLSITCMLNVISINIVIGLTLYKRRKYGKKSAL